jgi:ABC-type antimicrobial peptide transport system permease subunit
MSALASSGAAVVCALPGCSKVVEQISSGEARRYCCPAHRKIARKRRRDRQAALNASANGRPARASAPAPAKAGAPLEAPTIPITPVRSVATTTSGQGAEPRSPYRRLVPEPRPPWYRRSARPFAARGFRRNRPLRTLPPLPSDPEWLRPAGYHPEPRRTVIHVGRPTVSDQPQEPGPAAAPPPPPVPAQAPPVQATPPAPMPPAPPPPPVQAPPAYPAYPGPAAYAAPPAYPAYPAYPSYPPYPPYPEPPAYPPYPVSSNPPAPATTPEPTTQTPHPPTAARAAVWAGEAWRATYRWCARHWAELLAGEGVLARSHAALTQLRTQRRERRAATEAERRDAEAVLRGTPLPGEPVVEPKRRKKRPQPVVFQAAENSAWAGQMREALLAALHSVTINKLRSLLTTVGIVVGVAAVIVLVALGNGMKASFDAQFGKLANQITITPAKSSTPSGQASRNLTDRDVKALGDSQRAPHIAAISPAIVGNVPLSVGQSKDKATLVGASENYLDLLNRHLVAGQWFTTAQINSGARATIIGPESLNQLWEPGTDPHQVIGSQIRIGHSLFTVQGVLASDGQNDKTAIVPFAAARAHLVGDRGGKIDMIIIKSTSPATVVEATSEVVEILDSQHNIHAAPDRDYNAQNFTELLRKQDQFINFLTMFIVAIAAISLLVGGIGVANIMLVSVTERTREIGIRKAIGAKTSAILRQFLSEAVMLTGLGGFTGIVLGLGLTQAAIILLPHFGAGDSSGDPDSQIPIPVMSVEPVLIAFVVSLVIGVLAGGYPARRAARLRPIEALRFE